MEAGSNGQPFVSGLLMWLGEAGWLVRELQCMETIRWGNDGTEYYIIYEEDTIQHS